MKKITAYIRLANEENTILSCLESIRDIFDQILIIYSEITDYSLELVTKYIEEQNITNITIKQYPHSVLPPHSLEYKNNTFKYENSLAAYYNFGLQFMDTDLLMKIDADQIYFNDILSKKVYYAKQIADKHINIAFKGYNSLVHNNSIVLSKNQPINGGDDHFIISLKDANFIQESYWELLQPKFKKPFSSDCEKYWFHFKKGHRFNNKFVSADNYKSDFLECFDESLVLKYKKYILPLLQKFNSKYQYLKYKC
jgi:hypothetical protein